MVRIASYHQSRDGTNPSGKRKPHYTFNQSDPDLPNTNKVVTVAWSACIAWHPLAPSLIKSKDTTLQQYCYRLDAQIQPLANCMSFSADCGSLRSGRPFSQKLHPKMSVKTKNTINASKARKDEKTGKTITGVSFDLVEEKIRARLETILKLRR